MSALARQHITGSLARAANDDCINSGSCNRTKYTYDANGNALTRPGYSTMTWSSYNYPTSISTGYGPGWTTNETVGFSYGPNRQRWQQTYSGNNTTETTDYIGRLLEFVSSGGVLDYRHYINGGTGVVAVYSRKSTGVNTFSYLLSDHQSSVASITNSSGAQVIGESFTAFGTRREATTWSGVPSTTELTTMAGITRQGYTFQTALGLWSGLNHMKGRVEDGWSGRMLSADPTIPDPTNTQSYNRFSYVNNNPVTYGDPSGFSPCWGCKPIDGSYQYGALCRNCWKFSFTDPGLPVLNGNAASVGGLLLDATASTVSGSVDDVTVYSFAGVSQGGSANGDSGNGSQPAQVQDTQVEDTEVQTAAPAPGGEGQSAPNLQEVVVTPPQQPVYQQVQLEAPFTMFARPTPYISPETQQWLNEVGRWNGKGPPPPYPDPNYTTGQEVPVTPPEPYGPVLPQNPITPPTWGQTIWNIFRIIFGSNAGGASAPPVMPTIPTTVPKNYFCYPVCNGT
jgi:RHS repeat-associated protein